MRRTSLTATALIAALLALTGCGAGGGHSESRPDQDAALVLEGAPGAVDAGVYLAQQRAYDDAEGVRLQLRPPATPTDAVRSIAGGQAELGIVDAHDLVAARERGRDLVGVMALTQTPLTALITAPGVRRARDLEGRSVGLSGRPGDRAVLRALVRADGGDPTRVREVHTGRRGVEALAAGRVDAIVGSWAQEGVAARAARPGVHVLRIERFGAPPYPELLLATSRETLDTKGPVVRAAVRALRRGYEAAIADPESAVSALTDADPSLRRDLVARQLDAVSPSFRAGASTFGELRAAGLDAWAAWERRMGIARRPVDVAAAFDPATSRAGAGSDPNA